MKTTCNKFVPFEAYFLDDRGILKKCIVLEVDKENKDYCIRFSGENWPYIVRAESLYKANTKNTEIIKKIDQNKIKAQTIAKNVYKLLKSLEPVQ